MGDSVWYGGFHSTPALSTSQQSDFIRVFNDPEETSIIWGSPPVSSVMLFKAIAVSFPPWNITFSFIWKNIWWSLRSVILRSWSPVPTIDRNHPQYLWTPEPLLFRNNCELLYDCEGKFEPFAFFRAGLMISWSISCHTILITNSERQLKILCGLFQKSAVSELWLTFHYFLLD